MTNLISHGVFNPIKTGLFLSSGAGGGGGGLGGFRFPPFQIRKYKSYGNDASRIDSTYKYVNILYGTNHIKIFPDKFLCMPFALILKKLFRFKVAAGRILSLKFFCIFFVFDNFVAFLLSCMSAFRQSITNPRWPAFRH